MGWEELSLKLKLAKEAREKRKKGIDELLNFEVSNKNKKVEETPFVPFKIESTKTQKNAFEVDPTLSNTKKENEDSAQEKIMEKIKESSFKLKFNTINLNEIQKAPVAPTQQIILQNPVISTGGQYPPSYNRYDTRPKGKDIRKGIRKELLSKDERISLLRKINRVTPLITLTYNGKKHILSYAHIKWDEKDYELVYKIIEPKMTEKELDLLDEIKGILKERLNVDFESIRGVKAYNYIISEFNKIIKKIGIKLDSEVLLKFNYYVYRDFIGLGRLEPLMHDPNIEDIGCVGTNVPLFVYHRNTLLNQLTTNIVFTKKKELDDFVLKLAQKCGKSITLAEPLMEGALPDGSRVQATYGTKDIARRGSNFSIRKFTDKPMTPVDLIKLKTVNAKLLAYLWFVIENNSSILISGATASGKTTFLNALSLFIKPEAKIISIEDTAELRLPHPNWIAQVAREGIMGGEYGEITMYDLLKAGLRQRPDYIIVGEVRGEEAVVLFQGMATGHAALGTIHADSMSAVIDRLTNKPINLPKTILDNLDVVIFLEKFKIKDNFYRKVKEIAEIVGYDYNHKELITNSAFRWNVAKNNFDGFESVILDRIKKQGTTTVEELQLDMSRRIKLLNYLTKKNVNDYRTFSSYIIKYYNNPSFVETL